MKPMMILEVVCAVEMGLFLMERLRVAEDLYQKLCGECEKGCHVRDFVGVGVVGARR
jgi:hypothetical protein